MKPNAKAYCLRCQTRTPIVNPVNTKVGKTKAIKGKCARCGTKVMLMIGGK